MSSRDSLESENLISSNDRLLFLSHDDYANEDLEDEKELTFRAVCVGLVVGIILCFTNMYFGLQSGWVTMGTLQSALLGAGFFRVMKRFESFSGFSEKENVVLQTTAVATATMPLAAGFVGILPALSELDYDLDSVKSLGWTISVAYLGCFIAVPLRKQTILIEKLKFPSGTASAQLIKVLHSDDTSHHNKKQSRKRWKALGISFFFSSVYSFLAYFIPVIKNMPVFTWVGLPVMTKWLWTFNPALAYVGQGIIMGFKPAFSAFVGSIVGWGILGPMALHVGWVDSVTGKNGASGWVLWIALSVMLAEASVALTVTTIRVIKSQLTHSKAIGKDPAPEHEQIPNSWWVSGLILSLIVCSLIDAPLFKMPFWQPLLGCLIGIIVSVVAVRALGDTDMNPVSSIGKVSQVIFGLLCPNNMVANLVGGAIAEAGAQQAGDLMSALKTGHLLRCSPKANFIAQLIGTSVSIFASVAAYDLYKSAYVIGGSELSAPAAKIWKDMAELMKSGASGLPKNVEWFCLAGAIFGALIPLINLVHPKIGRYLPSGTAFAVGLYLQPYWVTPRLFGALITVIVHFYEKRTKEKPREISNDSDSDDVLLLNYDSISDDEKDVEDSIDHEETTLNDSGYESENDNHYANDQDEDEDEDEDDDIITDGDDDGSYQTILIVIASGLVLGDGITSIVTAGFSAGHVKPWTCYGCIENLCGGC